MNPGEDILAMIADINRAVTDDDLDLNEWETGLLTSVSDRAQSGRPLTGPQETSLDELWKKATGQ